jgi:hypothetical protein
LLFVVVLLRNNPLTLTLTPDLYFHLCTGD